MRLIQHKREAYWFYRVVSLVYDRWVNPLFWTEPMRDRALELARLDARGLRVLDAGAGTGFTTEGIVAHVDAAGVTMLDQSPHQLARAESKPAVAGCTRVLGDAEALPFADDAFDRYVSAGSIEYWPDPQRAIAEAYRVLRRDGVGLVVGPLPPRNGAARLLADAWMLFPAEAEYRSWMTAAGFVDLDVAYVAPEWHGGGSGAYGIAIAGRKPAAGPSPAAAPARAEPQGGPLRFALRFAVGSLAGLAFVPIALAMVARDRLARARRRA